ncbi:hypothetical protein [Shumkonia mesophila]|uniref:hypothetical protein n=1 Tax=Shumkonia mesophila TaxID=2838854 RepID=UPI0029348F4D|nr:hypothetical protein [Shumkonia mesophila]
MKRSLIALATVATLGLTALGATVTLADPADGPTRPGWGPAMMGGGYGPGMMGGGYGPGMMGRGYGPGAMMGAAGTDVPCPGLAAATANAEPLTLDDAQKVVQQRLAWMGNDRLKVGKVEAKGDAAFTAEIVTLDNSLVEKLEIDAKTGFMRPVR